MIRSLTRFCVVISNILGGLIAGASVNRYVVEVPAWRHMDVVQWANYSRHADLGNGFYLYPFLGIGLVIFSVAAAVGYFLDSKPESAKLPVYLTALLAIIGIGLTRLAAPVMLSLRTSGNEPKVLMHAFNSFHYWGTFRAWAQVLAFFTSVWATVQVYSKDKR